MPDKSSIKPCTENTSIVSAKSIARLKRRARVKADDLISQIVRAPKLTRTGAVRTTRSGDETPQNNINAITGAMSSNSRTTSHEPRRIRARDSKAAPTRTTRMIRSPFFGDYGSNCHKAV